MLSCDKTDHNTSCVDRYRKVVVTRTISGSWAFRWCQDHICSVEFGEVTANIWEGKLFYCTSLIVSEYLFLLSSLRPRRCRPDWLSLRVVLEVVRSRWARYVTNASINFMPHSPHLRYTRGQGGIWPMNFSIAPPMGSYFSSNPQYYPTINQGQKRGFDYAGPLSLPSNQGEREGDLTVWDNNYIVL